MESIVKQVQRLKHVYTQANRVYLTNKNIDRHFIVQTIFCLQRTPNERLKHGLLRFHRSRFNRTRN